MVAIMEFIRLDAHVRVPVRGRYTYYPNAAEAKRESMGHHGARCFQLLAEIEISGDAKGVICSQRSRGGGYSLYLQDGKLFFVHDVAGATPVKPLQCDAPGLGKHIVGVEFTRGDGHETAGAVMLSVDGRPMAAAPVRALPVGFAPCGEGLWIGCDRTAVPRSEYAATLPLVGARVIEIVFDACEEADVDGEHERSSVPTHH